MNNQCINIAISGLGLTASDDLKIRLRKILPNNIGINWTNVTDQNINCILINEQFFDNDNIQNIIHNKNIPYLKISKHCEHNESVEDNLLCIPIHDELILRNWVNIQLLKKNEQSGENQIDSENFADERLATEKSINEQYKIKDIHYFTDMYNQESRKLILSDQLGAVAIIDHYAHFAWLEASREEFKTDPTIEYKAANTHDFIKVSHKSQFNLENWLFNLIWRCPEITTVPTVGQYYRLKFWPQPNEVDKKILLQLTACFILGAEIEQVSNKLNIPNKTVQNFIAANLVIQNAELISAKDCQFDRTPETNTHTENKGFLKSFFGKLKNKFKF